MNILSPVTLKTRESITSIKSKKVLKNIQKNIKAILLYIQDISYEYIVSGQSENTKYNKHKKVLKSIQNL